MNTVTRVDATQKNPPGFYQKSPLKKKTIKPIKNALFASLKYLLRSKNKIGRTLLQLTVFFFFFLIKQNKQQRNLKVLRKREG